MLHLKITAIILAFLLAYLPSQLYAQSDDELVILQTRAGELVIEFFPDDAPNHVDNFLNLTKSGFYDRSIFHRIIENFMIQGGDPKTKPGGYQSITEWGTGDPGYTIDAEFNDIKHNRGIVSMARSTDPNSAGSQFFIVHKDSNFLDGQYTVFGRIATQESYDTLDALATLETAPNDVAMDWGQSEILQSQVVSRSDIPNLLEQGEPERTTLTPETPTTLPSDYTNEELGFSISFPEGWLVQEPEKTQPNVPDVAAVGPKTEDFSPSISVSVTDSNGLSLDERVEEIRNSLQTAIDSGQLEIISEENISLGGHDTFSISTKGVFITQAGPFEVKFKEYIISKDNKFFTVTYANDGQGFDSNLEAFEDSINSFKILSDEQSSNEEGIAPTDGGCLIATATFGSELTPQVQKLREIRDNTILQTESGKSFMTFFNEFYYSFSPTVADWERQNPAFKEVVKTTITPLVTSLSLLNYVEIDSEADILVYGVSLILLNIGMYFVAPAVIIYRLQFRKSQRQKFK